MWKLEEARTAFMIGYCAVCLLLSSFPLSGFLAFPSGERFSELWILGPNNMAEDYPFNVSSGENYMVYLGVGNHLGCSAYYTVYVKLRNETEPLPNSTSGTPSPIEPLFENSSFVRDGETWEMPLHFSFSNASTSGNITFVKTLTVNGDSFEVDKLASWDSNNGGSFYQLFIELWIYNVSAKALQYHNRFVGLWLNMTST